MKIPHDAQEWTQMQQEAIRRALEFQKRSRFPQPERKAGPQGKKTEPPAPPQAGRAASEALRREPLRRGKAQTAAEALRRQPYQRETVQAAPVLPGLLADRERLLILVILYVLLKTNGDRQLILALLYLL